MQYDDLPESSNIEDRRGEGPGGGGGFGGFPGGAGGLSIGTVVVLGLIGWSPLNVQRTLSTISSI